jgi:hypothetical protein
VGAEHASDPSKKEHPPMLAPLDIFKMQKDGTYVWKAAAESLELAESTVQRLAITSPGEYMIFNQATQNKTLIPLDGSTKRK